jgi:hypothetical protein
MLPELFSFLIFSRDFSFSLIRWSTEGCSWHVWAFL